VIFYISNNTPHFTALHIQTGARQPEPEYSDDFEEENNTERNLSSLEEEEGRHRGGPC